MGRERIFLFLKINKPISCIMKKHSSDYLSRYQRNANSSKAWILLIGRARIKIRIVYIVGKTQEKNISHSLKRMETFCMKIWWNMSKFLTTNSTSKNDSEEIDNENNKVVIIHSTHYVAGTLLNAVRVFLHLTTVINPM